MFIHPSEEGLRPTLDELVKQLAEGGVVAGVERDGDAVWLTIGDEAELSLTVDDGRVTSAMLEGIPDDPAVVTKLEGVFTRMRWDIDAGDDVGEF